MTLEEAIKHAEEVAEDKEIDAENQNPLFPNDIEECKKCAEEHRQLAEWLKDYKRLLEQELCEDAISRKYIQENYATCADMLHPDADIVMAWVDEAPPVRLAEKTGYWIKIKPYPLQMHDYECSECGHETDDNTEKHCSECGAKMEVVECDDAISRHGENNISKGFEDFMIKSLQRQAESEG